MAAAVNGVPGSFVHSIDYNNFDAGLMIVDAGFLREVTRSKIGHFNFINRYIFRVLSIIFLKNL